MKKHLSLFALFALLLGGGIASSIPTVAAATYTAAEVSTHNSASNCWTTINGKVYNITPYIPMHPGGAASITSICGANGTSAFGGMHGANAAANSALAGYYIGDLATADTSAPSIPTNLSATVISSSQINLAWTASTDNLAVTGYKIYKNGSLIGTVASNSYNNTGLNPATTYSYKVSAFDAAGNNSGRSNLIIATTLASSTTTPPTATSTPPNPPKHYDDDDDEDEDEDGDESEDEDKDEDRDKDNGRADHDKWKYKESENKNFITVKFRSKIRLGEDNN